MTAHLANCARPNTKDVSTVAHIRADVPGSPFWLDLDIKTNATMRHLDQALREVWLECCGHLSCFRVGQTDYVVTVTDEFLGFGWQREQRSMNTRVSAALPPVGSTITYEYDFGSTTALRLKVIALRAAPSRRENVRLLARNHEPIWNCSECGRAATALCSYCVHDDAAFVCETHLAKHACGDEAMLPVVNSPRMGVCGYTG